MPSRHCKKEREPRPFVLGHLFSPAPPLPSKTHLSTGFALSDPPSPRGCRRPKATWSQPWTNTPSGSSASLWLIPASPRPGPGPGSRRTRRSGVSDPWFDGLGKSSKTSGQKTGKKRNIDGFPEFGDRPLEGLVCSSHLPGAV